MKKFIKCLLLFLLMFCVFEIAYGQDISNEYTEKSKTGFYDANTGVFSESIIVENKSFDVYKTATGSRYVKMTNKEGKVYPKWIGNPTTLTYQGKAVRVTKSKKFLTLSLDENGGLKVTYLDKKTPKQD